MTGATTKGKLYLVPTPLDHGCAEDAPLDHVLPLGTIQTAASLGHWISENAKSTRAFLKRVAAHEPLAHAIQLQQIVELPRDIHKRGDHTGGARMDARTLLAPALAGQHVGLISEAGMPAIADPGSSVVRAAHALGIEVVPLVGPISLMLALAAGGLNGQNFAFVGYLPQDSAARGKRIRELETLALQTGQAQLMIETPYRNVALFEALLTHLAAATRLALAQGLTLPNAFIRSASVADWRRPDAKAEALARLKDGPPCVFALGA